MSFTTFTNTELLYSSVAAATAFNTFTTEQNLNPGSGGMGAQAKLPPDFWLPSGSTSKAIRIVARGILSSTGTPTFTFSTRLGAAGSTSAANVLGTAALTTGSGVTNQLWELEGDVALTAIGAAGANSTVRGLGMMTSPGLNPVTAAAWGGAATPGTVATVDTSIVNFINVNVACSASSASNSIQLLQLLVFGLN